MVSADGSVGRQDQSGKPLTDMGWEVYPEGLTELLLRVHRDWPLPPLIREGKRRRVQADTLAKTGVCTTASAPTTSRSHIAAVGAALRQGVPMAGYMVWSLLDNFEVGLGLCQALWHRARRLRQPAAAR